MKLFKEFKEFAIKGNMFDMTVGIIIGTAFGQVISSLVKDIMMPPFGFMLNSLDFSDMKVVLQSEQVLTDGNVREAVTLNYGVFITSLINFLIIAMVIFFMIKMFNAIRARAEDPEDNKEITPKDIQLLSEIRDL